MLVLSKGCFSYHCVHLSTFSVLLITVKEHIFLEYKEVVCFGFKERERGEGREEAGRTHRRNHTAKHTAWVQGTEFGPSASAPLPTPLL